MKTNGWLTRLNPIHLYSSLESVKTLNKNQAENLDDVLKSNLT
jgi:hypothetical protein